MIEYPYQPRRAAQAAHYLLWRTNGHLDVYGVVKLLYLADRETLLSRGRTMTGDRLSSMPWGPSVSGTYDLIKGKDPLEYPGALAIWREYIAARSGNRLMPSQRFPTSSARADALYDELSERDRATLEKLAKKYGGYSFEALKKVAHDLPEYQEVGTSSKPIDPARILHEEHWSEEDIAAVREDAEAAQNFRNVLQLS